MLINRQIACALLAVILCGKLFAADSLQVEYYEVEGADLRELRASLNARGPLGENGKRYHGFTKWRVNWNYKYQRSGQSCGLSSLVTHVVATITMPRWNAPADAPVKLRQEWRRYLSALRAHEDGHHNFAKTAAAQIERDLAELSNPSGCNELAKEIDARADAILDIYRAEEKAYDQQTRHGATQGARF